MDQPFLRIGEIKLLKVSRRLEELNLENLFMSFDILIPFECKPVALVDDLFLINQVTLDLNKPLSLDNNMALTGSPI